MGRRVKAGTVVGIEFDDHVQGADYVIRCVVYGRVHKCSTEHITVKSWDYAQPTAELDHNVEIFTIMQSAITKVTRYGKG